MSSIVHAPSGMTPHAAKEFFAVKRQYNNMKEAGKEAGKRTIRAIASVGTGAILGYMDGRYDYTEVGGVPIAAGVAVGGLIAGLFVGGELGEILATAGNAGGAIYGRDWAAQVGRDQKNKAGNSKPTGALGTGQTMPSGYTTYSAPSHATAGRW